MNTEHSSTQAPNSAGADLLADSRSLRACADLVAPSAAHRIREQSGSGATQLGLFTKATFMLLHTTFAAYRERSKLPSSLFAR